MHYISTYFFEKDHLSFSAWRIRSYFRGKGISPFLMKQERSYSSAIFLERPSFQNIWKKKIWFFVQCQWCNLLKSSLKYNKKTHEFVNNNLTWSLFKNHFTTNFHFKQNCRYATKTRKITKKEQLKQFMLHYYRL